MSILYQISIETEYKTIINVIMIGIYLLILFYVPTK